MSDRLQALALFVRVARTASFSRAAKELKLSQPTASRMITLLEKELGATLLARTTRAVTLTDAGAAYLERVLPVLAALEAADQSVRDTRDLHGALRVGMSSIIAAQRVVPRLASFLATHPGLTVELVVDDRRQHLLHERVDVAIRTGKLDDSTARSRRIGAWPILIAAAPSYLAAHGTPTQPSELADHRAILAGPLAGSAWVFTLGKRKVSVTVGGQLAVTSSEVGLEAAIAGVGIVAGSELGLAQTIARRQLVQLLPAWKLGEIEVHALFPSEQAPKPAARAFAEFFASHLRKPAIDE